MVKLAHIHHKQGAAMTSKKLSDIFAQAVRSNGTWVEYAANNDSSFIWGAGQQSSFQPLFDAVGAVRQYLVERRLDAGLRAARHGIEATLDFINAGGKFTTARDEHGLDAGYYLARNCTPYDFVALGVVEMTGSIQHVAQVRYYHQDPLGMDVLQAALEAGLTFTGAQDSIGHDACFFLTRSNHPMAKEIMLQGAQAIRKTA